MPLLSEVWLSPLGFHWPTRGVYWGFAFRRPKLNRIWFHQTDRSSFTIPWQGLKRIIKTHRQQSCSDLQMRAPGVLMRVRTTPWEEHYKHSQIRSLWARSHAKAANAWMTTKRAKSNCSSANHSRDQSFASVLCNACGMVWAVWRRRAHAKLLEADQQSCLQGSSIIMRNGDLARLPKWWPRVTDRIYHASA